MKRLLTYDDFLEKYHPIKNHLDKNAGYDGCMFETFGKELEFVLKTQMHSPRQIWTIINRDNNDMWIIPGYHYVNRLGFIITKEPINRNELDLEYCMEDYYTTGEARNHTIECMESLLGRELSDEEIDSISDYYSQL